MTTQFLSLLAAGLAIAGLAAALLQMRARLEKAQGACAELRAKLAAAEASAAAAAALRRQMTTLRHDMRGILSPALLVSDRLLSHEEAYVRRAGEVMIRTVERAGARLVETREAGQPPETSAQV